jgi:formate dehydrogenase major subunit
MIQVTIDGHSIEVPEKSTVLQATRIAGIDIPTLCDHPALKPYGGCRLCVVEVEGIRTLQASCTLPAYDGMVVHTDTPRVRSAREFVLTLLFSERNHFCMYCQVSGGDCELQNAAYGEEMTHWPLQPAWKPYKLDASHPYIAIDHNRCILCRRCVRACSDLVGNNTLAIENRGASSLLVADNGVPFGESSCIKCGTCVQVCPTGALIDRQGAYLGLEADARRIQSVCVGCSLGCGIELVVRDNQLIRIEGDWNAALNGGVLCELGRFQPLEDERERIETPLIRKNGSLQPASWEEALGTMADRLQPLVGEKGSEIAALASTRLPAETLHFFKELFAGQLQSKMVTSLEENLTSDRTAGVVANSELLESLKSADCVVVVGADLVKSHQVAGFFVKRNLGQNTRLVVIDPFENAMADLADFALKPSPGTDDEILQGIMAAIHKLGLERGEQTHGFDLRHISLDEISRKTGIPVQMIVAASQEIGTAQKLAFVFGKGLTKQTNHKTIDSVHALARMLPGAVVINMKGKANSFAAQNYGLNKAFVLEGQQAVYLALGDDYPTPRLMTQLEAVPFIAVQASYVSPATEHADIVLPVEMWAEQEGHYYNLEGRLQQAHKALEAPTHVRSNLAVLQELARLLALEPSEQWDAALA